MPTMIVFLAAQIDCTFTLLIAEGPRLHGALLLADKDNLSP